MKNKNFEHVQTDHGINGQYKTWFLDYASYVILERAVPAGRFDQHVARRHRVEHGLGDRLLQRDDARARVRVAPLLQRMEVR